MQESHYFLFPNIMSIAGPHLCLRYSFPAVKEWIVSIRYYLQQSDNTDVTLVVDCVGKHAVIRQKDDIYLSMRVITYHIMLTRENNDYICKYNICNSGEHSFLVPGMKSHIVTMYWSGNNIEMTETKVFVDYFISKNKLNVSNFGDSPGTPRGRTSSSISSLSLEEVGEANDLDLDRVRQHLEAVIAQNTKTPYHMLINGGSNMFMSDIWKNCHTLHKWLLLSKEQKIKYVPDTAMKNEITQFYKTKYLRYLSHPQIKQIGSAIPCLSAMDDEDIFNNFGSYSEWIQNSPLFKFIFSTARTLFGYFMNHISQDRLDGYKNTSFIINTGKVCYANLDTRSERNSNQVVSDKSLSDFLDKIGGQMNKDTKHLIVMIASPLIIPSQYTILQLLKSVTGPTQELIDNLPNCKYLDQLFGIHESEGEYFSDSWVNSNHTTEKLTLLRRIFDLAIDNNIRVTILSGNLELAGLTSISNSLSKTIKYNPEFIYQVICSGINSHQTKDVITKLLTGVGFQNDNGFMLSQNHEWKELTSEIGDTYISRPNWLSIQTGIEDEVIMTLHVLHEIDEDFDGVMDSDNRYLSIPPIRFIYKKRRLRNLFRKETIDRKKKEET